MKTVYNVVNAIICCAKEARASIVGLNRAKKEQLVLSEVCMIKKTAPHSIVYLRRDEKADLHAIRFFAKIYLGLTCNVNLSYTKNPD